MADELTPKHQLVLPEVGASKDSWGDKINTNFSYLDALLAVDTGVFMPRAGGTFTGPTAFNGLMEVNARIAAKGYAGTDITLGGPGIPFEIIRLSDSVKTHQIHPNDISNPDDPFTNRSILTRQMGDGRYALKDQAANPSRRVDTGSGLQGGGDLSVNRTLSVDNTVVRTSGAQTIDGVVRAERGLTLGGKGSESAYLTFKRLGDITRTQIITNDSNALYLRVFNNTGASFKDFVFSGADGSASFPGLITASALEAVGNNPQGDVFVGTNTDAVFRITRRSDGAATHAIPNADVLNPSVPSWGLSILTRHMGDGRYAYKSDIIPSSRTFAAGDGLGGGGSLASNRTFYVDSTVVRTHGSQDIDGQKTFNSAVAAQSSFTAYADTGANILLWFRDNSRTGNERALIYADTARRLRFRVANSAGNVAAEMILHQDGVVVAPAFQGDGSRLRNVDNRDLNVGAIGTYAFLTDSVARTTNPGTVRPGNELRYANAWESYVGGAPGGNWQCMGYCSNVGGRNNRTTLWLRVS